MGYYTKEKAFDKIDDEKSNDFHLSSCLEA